ncbi:MAG: hypothetical protein JNM77_09935 [Pseudonocardia sp.]|nr:hypothetical protein [Pseudonocardia sp.]
MVDRRKQGWGELTPERRRVILAGVAVRLVLQAAPPWVSLSDRSEVSGGEWR